MKAYLSDAFDLLLDLAYPRSCLLCGSRIQSQPLHGVCTSCLRGLAWTQMSLCERCGIPRSSSLSCSTCAQGNFVFDWVWSYGPYEGNLKKLIHAFKFENDRGVGRDLAHGMSSSEKLMAFLSGAHALVPVPLHPLKEKNRGYNQAVILAEELARVSGLPVLGRALQKCKTSVPQTELGRQARWNNVSDTFTLTNPKAIAGWDLVLVDDVMTTGATVHHCAQLLRRAGAGKLGIVVVARSLSD